MASVGGELHELGARTTADFFEMAGFEVRYLGASMPTDSLVALVREDPVDLLVLSVTMSFHLDALREAVYRTREAAGDGLRVAVGGQAFTWVPSLVKDLGAEVYGRMRRNPLPSLGGSFTWRTADGPGRQAPRHVPTPSSRGRWSQCTPIHSG